MVRTALSLGVIVTLIVALIALTQSEVSAQDGPITVEGLVANGTPDSEATSDIEITLHMEGLATHEHMLANTDADGKFRFDGIQFDPSLVYGISLRHEGALYGSDLNLSNGPPPPITLTVYDSLADQELIQGTVASVLFAATDKATQNISALEIIQVVNNSDYTYVPGTDNPMNLLRFGLPPEAHTLQVDTRLVGADIVQVDRGFAVLASVPPGVHEIMYTYQFPYSGSEATFTKSLPFGAENLRVLSPHEVLTLSSKEAGDPESITIGERPYQIIQATDLPRGARIDVELAGLPKQNIVDKAGQAARSTRLEIAVPIVMALFLAGVAIFAIRRRRSKGSLLTVESSNADQERQTIQVLISDLESNFKAGSVIEDDYMRRRRILESRLTSISEN